MNIRKHEICLPDIWKGDIAGVEAIIEYIFDECECEDSHLELHEALVMLRNIRNRMKYNNDYDMVYVEEIVEEEEGDEE